MSIFGRNKQEEGLEAEDEFDEEDGGESRKFTKKFRDLNPKNKRKRKEPPKPWGVKERIFVLVILLVTAIVSGVLALGARNKNTSRFRMPTFDINSLNIFKEETIIVGKK